MDTKTASYEVHDFDLDINGVKHSIDGLNIKVFNPRGHFYAAAFAFIGRPDVDHSSALRVIGQCHIYFDGVPCHANNGDFVQNISANSIGHSCQTGMVYVPISSGKEDIQEHELKVIFLDGTIEVKEKTYKVTIEKSEVRQYDQREMP